MVHVHFVSQLFNLPLKTEERLLSILLPKNKCTISLHFLFGYVFPRQRRSPIVQNQITWRKSCQALSTLVTFNVKEVRLGGWVKKLADGIKKDGFLDSYGNSLIRRLLDAGMPFEEIVWIIIPTAAAATANQGQQVHLYL